MHSKTHICKYCKIEFDMVDKQKNWMANHTRWCDHNPKFLEYRHNLKNNVHVMNAAKNKNGRYNQYLAAKLDGKDIPKSLLAGGSNLYWKGKKHSDATKNKMRISALNSKHRRLVKSSRKYEKSTGEIVILDSSWEEELAKRLDKMGVQWDRPCDPLIWIDSNNVSRRYFPDFYLTEYDIYLDPKNPEAVKQQTEKLNYVLTYYNNVFILTTLNACKQFDLSNFIK